MRRDVLESAPFMSVPGAAATLGALVGCEFTERFPGIGGGTGTAVSKKHGGRGLDAVLATACTVTSAAAKLGLRTESAKKDFHILIILVASSV